MTEEIQEKQVKQNGVKSTVILFLKGALMGIANVIPGVSGGTIAVIVGVFDRLIEAVNTLFKNFKKNILYLLPLVIGMGASILGLSKVMTYCLGNFATQTNFFFVGLVVGSIPLIYQKASEGRKLKLSYVIAFVLGAASVIALAVVKTFVLGDAETEPGVLPSMTVGIFFKYLFGGILASSAMVAPGISGSLVMVLIGLYDKIMAAVSGITAFGDKELFVRSLLTLIPIGIGIVIGVFTIAKIVEVLLKKFEGVTYYCIFGLMAGSFAAILINLNLMTVTLSFVIVAVSVITCIAGFFTAFFLGRS